MPETMWVIFDMDGVLIDSFHAHYQSWCRLAAEIGRTYTEAEFVRGFGRTSRENIVEQWSDRNWTTDEVRRLDDRKESLFREIIRDQFPAMAGATELIRSLNHAEFRIAAGSSGPPENVNLVIERLGVAEIVQCRITASDVTRGKPDPQVFQLAAAGLSLPASACGVIEDAPAGIQAAHAAGIICIGLASTGRTRQELDNAEAVVDALSELTPARIGRLIQDGLR